MEARNKRLAKELKLLGSSQVKENFQVTSLDFKDKEDVLRVKLFGVENTLYAHEVFELQMRFPSSYPLQSPEVQFLRPAPRHPHIYSNGHICLSILYEGWSPAMRVESILLSILSMLSSASIKEHPDDDKDYVQFAPKSSKATTWTFHDDRA